VSVDVARVVSLDDTYDDDGTLQNNGKGKNDASMPYSVEERMQ